MQNREWKLSFWTTGNPPAADRPGRFGCSSHGLCVPGRWVEPGEPACLEEGPSLEGTVLAGTYREVATALPELGFTPALCLAFAAIGTGVEAFLQELGATFPGVPVAGGCAARASDRGELVPDASELSLLAVRSGSFEVASHNLLDPASPLAFEAAGPRILRRLQVDAGGPLLPAIQAFAELQQRLGRSAADHESLTLADSTGRNMHFHEENGDLVSGTNLPAAGCLVLRSAAPEAVAGRLESLLAVPGTLLLGCAGLRSILPRSLPAAPGSLGAFLFGEIGPIQQEPAFGNLMVTTVRRLS